MTYDRAGDGWDLPLGGRTERKDRIRPVAERQRCGPYTAPGGEPSWGDHRVTYPGSTCVQVDCHVRHAVDELPGWSEPVPDFYDRPGARTIAAALFGWDAAGHLNVRLGDTTAWVAAHVALDALRDAGYVITAAEDRPS